MINIEQIMQYLPHRYPMLLVDRILEVIPGKKCVGLKNVTINEEFFIGHYPGRPIMPGVLIIEAMAQAGAILILSDPANAGKLPIIGSIDNVKLKRPVVPGDQLISDTELLWFRNNIGKMRAVATVDGEVAASMELTFKVVPPDHKIG
ncbi:MAG TPA: 3-hydroxyacyl-ACP dehydratase FabZ [Fimbriimonadaceae bacterium]